MTREHEEGESGETSTREAQERVLGDSDPAELGSQQKRQQIEIRDQEAHVRLRRAYAWSLLVALVLQVLAIHVVFVLYLLNNEWSIDAQVFIAYLATTLGETVGLALVVTRHLFPRGS